MKKSPLTQSLSKGNALGSFVDEYLAEHVIFTVPDRHDRIFYRRGNVTWSANVKDILTFPCYHSRAPGIDDLKQVSDFQQVMDVFRQAPEIWNKEP